MDDNNHVDFDAPATLRKWPSIKNERARAADGPYLIVDGTLDDCIRQFMAKPTRSYRQILVTAGPGTTSLAACTRPVAKVVSSRKPVVRQPKELTKRQLYAMLAEAPCEPGLHFKIQKKRLPQSQCEPNMRDGLDNQLPSCTVKRVQVGRRGA